MSFMYHLGGFLIAAFGLGLRSTEFVYGSFRSRVLVSCDSPTLLKLSSADFHSSSSEYMYLEVGYLMWGLNPICLREGLHICDIPHTYESVSGGTHPHWTNPLPLLLFSMWLLIYIFSCSRAVLLVFRLSLANIVLYVPLTLE